MTNFLFGKTNWIICFGTWSFLTLSFLPGLLTTSSHKPPKPLLSYHWEVTTELDVTDTFSTGQCFLDPQFQWFPKLPDSQKRLPGFTQNMDSLALCQTDWSMVTMCHPGVHTLLKAYRPSGKFENDGYRLVVSNALIF
jgi:hypothetical protein